MKNGIRLLVFALLLIPFTVMAEENNKPAPKHLASYNNDVTGDTEKETITLKGVSFADDTKYYMDTWAFLSSKDGGEWEIQYDGGYEPQMHFHDLNHDGVKDILYQSLSNKKANLYDYQLHTVQKNQLKQIPLPKQTFIQAMFKDDFQVEVKIAPDKDPSIVDISDRDSRYIELGIYDQNGELIEENAPMIEPIASFKPVKINKQKGYGLKSKQRISGAFRSDQLGTVETLWYFEKDQWIILKTEWVPSN
ncbi:hypothetical protein GCM10008983_11990 [Lentibacillus halophilus]|uniref:Repeat domain-containing protein n=1 Tax=Lentibacillus halophilus TaxID=295065 RepID=A0ABN0Z7L9_9BACI